MTIVTQGRKQLFGHIVDGEMVLNDVGKMVTEIVEGVPQHYQSINVEASVIMPNHIHILFLIAEVVAGPRACQSDQSNNGQPQGVAPTKKQLSLPEIVHRIKSLTTHRYMLGVRDKSWPRFEKRLWQRNYYEHVIRNERDYQAVYDYIIANPMNWDKDEENPCLPLAQRKIKDQNRSDNRNPAYNWTTITPCK